MVNIAPVVSGVPGRLGRRLDLLELVSFGKLDPSPGGFSELEKSGGLDKARRRQEDPLA